MSKTSISPRIQNVLWAQAAGRCQYDGCNKSLVGDYISGNENGKYGFIAHIVADSPAGPRGDAQRSVRLANELSNLMLLCYTHHKLVDVEDIIGHPEPRLLEMKAAHERRIAIVTDIKQERASTIIRYGASIGTHPGMSFQDIKFSIMPNYYPANGRSIDLDMIGVDYKDHESQYWKIQQENLQRLFKSRVRERLEAGELTHLSVFGLAPQPLLIELGRQLGDITQADVFQLHREPKGWSWPSSADGQIIYNLKHFKQGNGPIALVCSLSAEIDSEKVISILGKNCQIWKIGVDSPHNDMMRTKADLSNFRTIMRQAFSDIKVANKDSQIINIFPAMPVSAAVELGRVWMPKADLNLKIFDQNKTAGGFIPALEIF